MATFISELSEAGYAALKGGISGYLRSRCEVRSQHKLPDLHELLESLSFDHIKVAYGATDQNLHDFVAYQIAEGRWFMYGEDLWNDAQISDHEINVL